MDAHPNGQQVIIGERLMYVYDQPRPLPKLAAQSKPVQKPVVTIDLTDEGIEHVDLISNDEHKRRQSAYNQSISPGRSRFVMSWG